MSTISDSYEKPNNKSILKPSFNKNEIINYINSIFEFIQRICKYKLENKNKSFSQIIKENQILKEVEPIIPYIMSIDEFDSFEKYYTYIIKMFKYNLINIMNLSINLSKDYLYKDLYDICFLMNLIIAKDSNSLNDKSIKFFSYHIINSFSQSDKKIEKSNIFFKMGAKILSDEYKIKNDNKYFPENLKVQAYKDFLGSFLNILTDCHLIYSQVIKKNIDFICDEFNTEINIIKKNINELIFKLNEKGEIPSNEIIAFNIKELNKIFNYSPIWKIIKFNPYKTLILQLLNHINQKNEYDILYPLCFIRVKKPMTKIKTISTEILNTALSSKFFEEILKYNLIFDKYENIISILNNDNKTNVSNNFKSILKKEQFRKKIINFFDSKSMRIFLKNKIDDDLFKKIRVKYSDFINHIKTKKFWDSIMFYTLPKYIKAFVSNYMRIIINYNFIAFSELNIEESKKNNILEFILFELIIHELLHYLRRYCLTNVESKKALTPPNSDEIKENKLTGEIGEELIKYYFGIPKINSIRYPQAIEFNKLRFEKDEDFHKIKEIINMQPSSKDDYIYAKFINTSPKEKDSIYAVIEGDCLFSSRISKFKIK